MGTKDNHFIFSGHDTVELAKQFGTPLYALSENIIRENATRIIDAFRKQDANYQVVYAGKALLNTAMCNIIKDLNMGVDVVSGGELYTCKKAGFPMDRVYFHGNNKSIDELNMAIEYGVGRVIIDNNDELEILNILSKEKNKQTKVLFRITPGIEAHTHKYIQTGQEDSKFGISIKEAKDIIAKASRMKGIHVKGVHCHIGSQILEERPYEVASEIMMDFIKDLNVEHNIIINELNLGGGFGIAYSDEINPFNMEGMAEKIVRTVYTKAKEYQINTPKIIVEPGRYIVANAGITLYEIGSIKEIPNIRKYVSVNGGMADNPRTALYDAKYNAVIANKILNKKEENVSIAGKCCESGDMLIWDISLPICEKGDILAVFGTGAYNYSMSSNYNRLPRPSMVLLKDDKAEVIVERESFEDITRNDRVASWLK